MSNEKSAEKFFKNADPMSDAYVDEYEYRKHELFMGKPGNREFRKFRENRGKRYEKGNKPQRGYREVEE